MTSRAICSTALLFFALTGTAVAQQAPAPAAPAAAAPAMAPASPVVLANSCASCHGVDGKGFAGTKVPAINGRPAQELSTIMKSFKADQVTVTIMNRLAKGYTDAEINSLAGYFAAIR